MRAALPFPSPSIRIAALDAACSLWPSWPSPARGRAGARSTPEPPGLHRGSRPSSSMTASTPIRWGSPMWRPSRGPTPSCELARRAPMRWPGCGFRPSRSTFGRRTGLPLEPGRRRSAVAPQARREVGRDFRRRRFALVRHHQMARHQAHGSHVHRLLPPICRARRRGRQISSFSRQRGGARRGSRCGHAQARLRGSRPMLTAVE